MMFTSTFTMIYNKIVATTFGAKVDRESSQRERERELREKERERDMERRTFERERFAVKNSKGFGHLSRQAARGNGKRKGIQSAGQTNRGLTIHILSTIIPRYREEGWPNNPRSFLRIGTDRR